MKKIFKTALSIFMCTVFSALTFFTVTAVLPPNLQTKANEFYQQHCELAPDRDPSIKGLRKWKLRLVDYVELINKTSVDKSLIMEFLLNLMSKITGNKSLESVEVDNCNLIYSPDEGQTGTIVFDFVTTSRETFRIII